MNVLSLFDGLSCGRIALEKSGIHVENYYASELDKNAIKVASANWPNTIQLGDVTKWREWNIDWSSIDLLIGGSPCQGFSYVGKQLAFDDPRSVLFFTYVDIRNHINEIRKLNGLDEVKFLLENVKMKKEHMLVISEYLGVNNVFINSGVISPCERPRNYWANFEITQPSPVKRTYGDVIDYQSTENTMSDGWHIWWEKNKTFQLKKKYSAIVEPHQKAITMTARQYASWNGSFIKTPESKYRKPTKHELAMLIGAPRNYFDCVNQRQTEMMTGNGWTIDVIVHIFSGLNSPALQVAA